MTKSSDNDLYARGTLNLELSERALSRRGPAWQHLQQDSWTSYVVLRELQSWRLSYTDLLERQGGGRLMHVFS